MSDPVNPDHYKSGTMEVIDFIREQLGDEGFAAYCRGSILKYVSRSEKKGSFAQDMAKAAWYSQMGAHANSPTLYEDPRPNK